MRRGNNARWSRGGQPRPNGRRVVNPNRSIESNAPDVGKVRGNAGQLYERYTGLARDAQSSGDRISAESYLQYAEHYYRVMGTGQRRTGGEEGQSDAAAGNGQGGHPASVSNGAAPDSTTQSEADGRDAIANGSA